MNTSWRCEDLCFIVAFDKEGGGDGEVRPVFVKKKLRRQKAVAYGTANSQKIDGV